VLPRGLEKAAAKKAATLHQVLEREKLAHCLLREVAMMLHLVEAKAAQKATANWLASDAVRALRPWAMVKTEELRLAA